MNVVVCLDEKGGMLFNKRRQSRDVKVIEDVIQMAELLWISPFSKLLFEDVTSEVMIDDDFLEKAGTGEFCFVENQAIMPYIDRVDQIIVYRWNRNYPSDFCLDVPLTEWKLLSEMEFAGKSHEKITKQIFIRG